MSNYYQEKQNKKIISEFRELFIPKNEVGDISIERYLKLLKGIEKFMIKKIEEETDKLKTTDW